MRSLNRIEIFTNGSIIAPCHLFSLGHDVYAGSFYFRRITIRVILATGLCFVLVFYIYLRRLFSFQKMIHHCELFRHNWCVDTEQKERRLQINERNCLFDTSVLDDNIDVPSELNKPPSVSMDYEGEEDEEILGLLPGDKLVSFPNPYRMTLPAYIVLIIAVFAIWVALQLEMMLFATGFNVRQLFTDDCYAFARMVEILKTHRRLFDGQMDMHKCFGSVEDLKTSISSSVMTTMQLLVWDRSIASSMVTIVTPVLALGVLLDLALHGLFLCILNHRNVAEDGKYYVYIHNVGYKFLITYFVFTSFCLTMMFLEMASWKVDRGISCPENRYLCASLNKNPLRKTTNSQIMSIQHSFSGSILCIRNEASVFLFDKETIDHNPYHQVNHRRKLQDIMKDIKIINAITNTPIPPPLPLTSLDHLKVNLAARKYI